MIHQSKKAGNEAFRRCLSFPSPTLSCRVLLRYSSSSSCRSYPARGCYTFVVHNNNTRWKHFWHFFPTRHRRFYPPTGNNFFLPILILLCRSAVHSGWKSLVSVDLKNKKTHSSSFNLWYPRSYTITVLLLLYLLITTIIVII